MHLGQNARSAAGGGRCDKSTPPSTSDCSPEGASEAVSARFQVHMQEVFVLDLGGT